MRRLVVSSLAVGLAALVASADDWPQWRGPNRDGVSKETGLLKEWPKDGPPVRWKRADLGEGYSTPSVAAGRVYLQTNKGGDEFVVALDEKTGADVWAAKIGGVGQNRGMNWPGTRSTPTVDGDRVYGLASDGELTCLGTDGKPRWHKSLVKDFGGRVGTDKMSWAYSESVLVDGDVVVCTPGGDEATLVALNKRTGDVVWKCPVPGGDAAEYASVMPVDAGGKKQYVQFLRKGVVGVDAKTGKFLWRYAKTVDQSANMLTPVVLGNKVFTAGGRTGGGLVELTVEGDGVTAKEVYFDKALAAGIGGAVLVGGHLYGATAQVVFCAEFGTGKVLWTDRSVGAAAVCAADGRVYLRGQKGEVALIEPTPAEYREKGRFTQPDPGPKPTWPHPVVANGGLYLRAWNALLCYDVKAK
ncbi:MAG: PQQ-like beta-propeller repeat protein [Gemmataceae bacterium]|nr:PQQ-like beta-propeller repeat protein [Gemmataceae bacterium]